MRQAGESVEALGLAAQGFGQDLAGDVGVGHAVAAATLGIVDVVADAADLGQAREGQQEVAGPGEVDLHVLQLREGLEHLRPDDRLDVRRIASAIDHAATIDQALVAGEAIVVEQVIAVFHAVVLRQQAVGQFLVQRLGGDHLGAAGHRLGRQFRDQAVEVGVTGDHDELRLHLALRGMHHRAGAALDAGRRALLVDSAAERLHRRRFAEGEVQRMDVAAAHVKHATYIVVGRHHLADALGVHDLQLVVAVAFPQLFLRAQVIHLLLGEGGEHPAVLQVALDTVAGHALADDAPAFEGHLAEQLRFALADGALDHVDVAAVAVDDLAAVAPGSAEADLGGFQYGDLETILQQEQGGGEAGIAGTDHADVGFDLALEFRAGRRGIGRRGVIGGGVGGVRHLAPLFFIFYGCPDATRVEIGRLASVQNFQRTPRK